jgi:hypothetical protein
MLSEKQIEFIRNHAPHIFSKRAARMAFVDPQRLGRAASRFLRSLLFNVNLKNHKIDQINMYKDALVALSGLSRLAIADEAAFGVEALQLQSNHADITDLAKLLTYYGSDKATRHDYHRIYGAAFNRAASGNILEIGLGTNNIDVPANMGLTAHPGASLRGFRDWAVNAHVYGADVDRRILFQETRISTFWVDQTNRDSLKALVAQLAPKSFDLIIDDGLHLPHANLNTMCELLPLLSSNGTFVIEDILPEFNTFWQLTRAIIAPRYESSLTRMKGAYAFIVRSRGR